jgi:transketolase
MRRVFGEFIANIASEDENIILIVGDIGYGVFDKYRELYPDRFINFGLTEQSMIGAAAGMALEGLKPWVYTITPFLIERPFEQIKLDIDQQNVNVKLVGYADYPDQGPTHAEISAPYLMNMFRNIESFYPRNNIETQFCLERMFEIDSPAFISLKKA